MAAKATDVSTVSNVSSSLEGTKISVNPDDLNEFHVQGIYMRNKPLAEVEVNSYVIGIPLPEAGDLNLEALFRCTKSNNINKVRDVREAAKLIAAYNAALKELETPKPPSTPVVEPIISWKGVLQASAAVPKVSVAKPVATTVSSKKPVATTTKKSSANTKNVVAVNDRTSEMSASFAQHEANAYRIMTFSMYNSVKGPTKSGKSSRFGDGYTLEKVTNKQEQIRRVIYAYEILNEEVLSEDEAKNIINLWEAHMTHEAQIFDGSFSITGHMCSFAPSWGTNSYAFLGYIEDLQTDYNNEN